MNDPGSTELGIPVWAVAMVPLPIGEMPGHPDLPRERHRLLERRAAGDPDLSGKQRRARRRVTPCAICTRLSIFAPAPIRVSPTAGRSMVVFAPISTSSSITTSPTCGIL